VRAVHHAIDVAAPPERVWGVLTDLSTWTRWFPFLRDVRVHGGAADPWRVGARFTMRFAAGPLALPVTVTVEECDAPYKVRWVGGRLGLRGDHAYTIDVRAKGVTRFTSHEEFTGPLSRLVAGPVFARLDDATHRSMDLFRNLVEQTRA
jgi:uncharacterized protein YndB with AHSA1/START domain